MQNNLKHKLVAQGEDNLRLKIFSVQLARKKEREIRALTKGLVNRLNLQPHGQELLGLIGDYKDKDNMEAVSSWLQNLKESGILKKVIDGRKDQSVISRLVLKIESEIQELFD